ncbi:RNA polymerase (RNAP)-binding regulatory protein, arsenate reductase (ArsC) family, Spx subfamily [Lactiplantibacillus plantarum]|nr:Spx/MgsR family RNA polymerase-binding regulatory protein [Lactiplantibacillus plantarum]VDH09630.1 RNA polymerase (RNAP)-binding regulatory protein, arsenate reductase (ArsC) family, Spx subfamily [Lactiplantibacillus plantarum]
MTVNLYYSTSSKSSRSARAWLVENNIPFNERDIIANPLDRDELKQILRLTENGFEDIVSTRSKAFKALHIDLSDLGFNQLLDLLVEKPQLLKRPIKNCVDILDGAFFCRKNNISQPPGCVWLRVFLTAYRSVGRYFTCRLPPVTFAE